MKYHVTFVKSSGIADCREYNTKKEMNESLDVLKVRHDIVTLFWFKVSDGFESRVYVKGESEEVSEEQETSEQETSEQETSEQETSEQETSEQETSEQETSEQETSEQETSEQETSEQNNDFDFSSSYAEQIANIESPFICAVLGEDLVI